MENSTMYRPILTIVVLNWNSIPDIFSCLESLKNLSYTNTYCVVVDNGSTDHSVEQIQVKFPEIPIIETGQNLGYTGGNNAGIRWAMKQGSDWVLLLNPDVILASDALDRLVNFGQMDPGIGILGPTVYHSGSRNLIQSAGGLFDARWRTSHRGQNQVDHGQFPKPEQVGWVSGCALLARVKMIEEIGLLDDRFFAYHEEVDYCVQATKKGWKIVHVPEAHIWHSGITSDIQPKPNVTYYMTRNRLLMLLKNRVGWKIWQTALFDTSRTLLSWSVRPKWRHNRAQRDAMWQGTLDFFRRQWGMRLT